MALTLLVRTNIGGVVLKLVRKETTADAGSSRFKLPALVVRRMSFTRVPLSRRQAGQQNYPASGEHFDHDRLMMRRNRTCRRSVVSAFKNDGAAPNMAAFFLNLTDAESRLLAEVPTLETS